MAKEKLAFVVKNDLKVECVLLKEDSVMGLVRDDNVLGIGDTKELSLENFKTAYQYYTGYGLDYVIIDTIYVVTHGMDNDGKGVELVTRYLWSKEYYVETIKLHDSREIMTDYLSYDGVSTKEKLNLERFKGERVIMGDITLDEQSMDKIYEIAHSFNVYDHHHTPDLLDKPYMHHSYTESGTSVMWNTMVFDTPNEMVKGIRARDIFDKESYEHTDWFYIALNNASMKEAMECLLDNSKIPFLLESYRPQYEEYMNTLEKYMENATEEMVCLPTSDDKGLKAYYVIVTRDVPKEYVSDVGNALCKRHPEIDFYINVDKSTGVNLNYTYGLRSVGEFDTSSISRAMGGGGHKNASGFSATSDLVSIEDLEADLNRRTGLGLIEYEILDNGDMQYGISGVPVTLYSKELTVNVDKAVDIWDDFNYKKLKVIPTGMSLVLF